LLVSDGAEIFRLQPERASDRGFIDRVIAGQRHDLESGLVEPAAKVCS